jgi:hypothetical protein
MATKSIDTIQIGGYPAGQFAGGYIYSMNMTQGYAEEINKLTIDVVYEDSSVNPSFPTKDLVSSFSISVGRLNFPKMHFLSSSVSKSLGQTTASCTFADDSVKLDRYYVGLYNRHGKQSAGNLIIVGSPQANTDAPCSADDINYRIDELMSKISGIININRSFGYLNTLNYTGTIRQVLSNIGSDFGFSFYWDMMQDKLVFVDLKNAINLSNIESISNNTSIPLADFKSEETLEGTYAKGFSNFSAKNGGVKEVTYKEWSRLTYVNIPANITNLAQCFLASVNPTLRTLYALSEGRYSQAGVFGFNPFNGATFSYIDTIFNSFINEIRARGFPHVIGACDSIDSEGEKAITQLEANEFQNYGKYYRKTNIVTIAPDTCGSEYSRKITSTFWPGNDSISNQEWGSASAPDFTRNPNTTVEGWLPSQLDPLFLPVTDELADQLLQFSLRKGFRSSDFFLRGKTLIAFPKISVTVSSGENPNEEAFQPAVFSDSATGEDPSCLRCARRTSNTSAATNSELTTPGRGLNSKRCSIVNVSTPGGGYLRGYLPSTDMYFGYVQLDVTESYNDSASSSVDGGGLTVPSTAMQYEHTAVDITNKSELDKAVKEMAYSALPLKNISFKIIGTDFSQISSYMNPESGLTAFSIYLDDTGIFSNFTYQSRPPTAPAAEIIMEKVSARKVSITG